MKKGWQGILIFLPEGPKNPQYPKSFLVFLNFFFPFQKRPSCPIGFKLKKVPCKSRIFFFPKEMHSICKIIFWVLLNFFIGQKKPRCGNIWQHFFKLKKVFGNPVSFAPNAPIHPKFAKNHVLVLLKFSFRSKTAPCVPILAIIEKVACESKMSFPRPPIPPICPKSFWCFEPFGKKPAPGF